MSPGATEIEDLLVQASNGLGVGTWRNQGDRPLVRTEVVDGVDVELAGDRHESGVYRNAVQATIRGVPGVRYDVLVDDVRIGTFGDGDAFPVTGDGVHEIEVIGRDGSLYGIVLAIDATAPTITWRSPPAGTTVRTRDPLLLDVLCQDVGTGADCATKVGGQPWPNGTALPTSRVGTYVIDVVATDAVGNRVTATRSYAVRSRYTSSGFQSPIAAKPTVNMVGAGKTIPVKFTVTSDGQAVTDPSIIRVRTWQPIDCTSKAPTGAAVAAKGTNPEYSGFFHFNVDAPTKRGCYELAVELDDGFRLTAWFRVT